MDGRTVAEFYDEPGMEWWLRWSGHHFHAGSEEATVALAARAADHGFASGGRVVEIASALGAPARFLARRFASTIVCIDMDQRMHRAAHQITRREGLDLLVHPVRARTERLPLADASCDGAWSQDALCHMDKGPVLAEVARVLRPGGVFAFSDFIARPGITASDLDAVRRRSAFPSLFTVAQYVAALAGLGLDVLLAEDWTNEVVSAMPTSRKDDELWRRRYVERWGEAAAVAQEEAGETWTALMGVGRAGYGVFIARRRAALTPATV